MNGGSSARQSCDLVTFGSASYLSFSTLSFQLVKFELSVLGGTERGTTPPSAGQRHRALCCISDES